MSVPVAAAEAANPLAGYTYITEELKPYNYTENGKLTGVAVEVLRLTWAEMDIQPCSIQVMPWSRAYDMLLKESHIVLFSTLRTEDRENLFKWVGPITDAKTVLIAKKGSVVINDLQDTNRLRVAVIKNHPPETYLAHNAPDTQLHHVSSAQVAIKMLHSGRVDAIALGWDEFVLTIDELELGHSSEVYEAVWTLNQTESYFALSVGTPDSAVARFQKALDTVRKTPAYQAIIDKFLD